MKKNKKIVLTEEQVLTKKREELLFEESRVNGEPDKVWLQLVAMLKDYWEKHGETKKAWAVVNKFLS